MTDRERAYEAVKNVIVDITKHPNKRAIKKRSVRTTLVANNGLEPKEYEKALQALVEQDAVIHGSGWLTPVVDKTWLRESIEYVADRADNPQEFVAQVNHNLE